MILEKNPAEVQPTHRGRVKIITYYTENLKNLKHNKGFLIL